MVEESYKADIFKKRLNEIFLVNCISLLVIASLFILRNCPLQMCSFYLAEVQITPDVADSFSVHCLRKLQLHLRENRSQPGRKRKEIYNSLARGKGKSD